MQNNANEMAVFNTAIYVRLSKEDIVAAQSGRESNSITNQKQLILDFLKDKPEFNIVSIRIDDGYTGTNFDRPAFQRMLNDIKAGRIKLRGRKRPVPFRKRVYQFRKVYPPSISCFRGSLNRYQ